MPGAGGDPNAVAVPVEIWGGLVTDMVPSELPHGVSPDCQDCKYTLSAVDIRPGLTSKYTLAGNPTVNYLKTYINLLNTPRLLSLDSLGNLRKDPAPGAGPLQLISSSILPGVFARSASLFGREYIAFGNGQQGQDIPRQYDDTNLDRISQVGPGAPPGVADENITLNTLAAPLGLIQAPASNINAPNGLTQVGNLVTLVITGANPIPPALQPGDSIVVAGAGVAGYNGTFQVSTVSPGTGVLTYYNPTAGLAASGGGTVSYPVVTVALTTPHGFGAADPNTVLPTLLNVAIAAAGVANYDGTWPVRTLVSPSSFTAIIATFGNAASGGATVNVVGNIAAGKHQVTCFFVTRNNAFGPGGATAGAYWTKPAPPVTWVAAGGKRAVVTNIPVGGPEIIARVLCFTAVEGASFYHLGPLGLSIFSSNMYIADNTTTSVTVDFSDEILLEGELDDPLFNLIELPPVMGAVAYKDRNFWWGELNLLQAFLNLSFDGGFSNCGSNPAAPAFTLPNYPLGWTPDQTFAPGGASAIQKNEPIVYGDAYVIVGDGATVKRGLITQSAANDYLGNPILSANTAYTVRARILCTNPAGAGAVHINLASASTGLLTAGISLAANQLTGQYALYTGNLTPGIAAIPSDLVLQIYADGTPTNGLAFVIDCIEILPTAQPVNGSNVRTSKAEDPESIDSQDDLMQVSLNDGDSVRSAFTLRERLYFVKDNSFHGTKDDGVNEPASWEIDEVSAKVGTPSVNGVAGGRTGGEDWIVIAHQTGLYIFWGGEPVKISQEIQPTWDSINWQYGWTISVTVDMEKRRVMVSAPFGNSTVPNKTLVLDYHDVGGAEQIASSPPINLTYTGRKTTFDKARKWCPWTIAANCLGLIQQANGTKLIYVGSNDGSGNINLLDENATSDNGAFIPQYYTTAGFVEQAVEQALQLGPDRKLFVYITLFATGAGTMGQTAYLGSTDGTAIALNPLTLADPQTYALEMAINIAIERVFLKFSASGVNQHFALQKLALAVKQDPMAPVAGAPGAPNVA